MVFRLTRFHAYFESSHEDVNENDAVYSLVCNFSIVRSNFFHLTRMTGWHFSFSLQSSLTISSAAGENYLFNDVHELFPVCLSLVFTVFSVHCF